MASLVVPRRRAIAPAEVPSVRARSAPGRVQGQGRGAVPGLGQGLVAVAAGLAEQAALGQADADEQQGHGELVGDVLEVVTRLITQRGPGPGPGRLGQA